MSKETATALAAGLGNADLEQVHTSHPSETK